MLKGIAVSEGIAQGTAFCIDAGRTKKTVKVPIERLKARAKSQQDFRKR